MNDTTSSAGPVSNTEARVGATVGASSTESSAETNGGTASAIRVLIVDDQALLRRSLQIIINGEPDLEVVGEAGTGREAVDMARETRPDVILMDIRMPDGDGIEATAAITADPDLADTKVLILTTFELDEYVYSALRSGASGFLLKDGTPAQLTEAVRRVRNGETLFAPLILTRLVSHFVSTGHPTDETTTDISGLTPREIDVLTHLGHGQSNSEIAQSLFVSTNTVKTHVSNLLTKLGARDRAQLVIAAYESGLVSTRG